MCVINHIYHSRYLIFVCCLISSWSRPAKLLNWVSMILGLGHANCQPYTNTFGTTPDHIRQIRRFSSNEGPVDDGRASQKQTTPGPENGMAGDRYGSHVVSNTVDIQ